MKQATNPQMPRLSTTSFFNNDDVTEKEIIYQLEKSDKSARMLLNEKKTFLVDVLLNRASILEQATLLDSVMGTSLFDALTLQIPRNSSLIKRRLTNSQLAGIIAKILRPLKMLRSFIVSQFEEVSKGKSNLRSSTVSQQKSSPILGLLDIASTLLDNLEKDVYAYRSKPTKDTVTNPVKITDAMRESYWSEDRVPVPHVYRFCVSCNHMSTNLPIENDVIAKHNDEIEKQYQKDIKSWDNYQRKVQAGENAKKPAGMKKRPYRKNIKQPVIMCMCFRIHCQGNFKGAADCCPIKCLKPIDLMEDSANAEMTSKESVQERYPRTAQPDNDCTCPICMCNCSFACFYNDVDKILLKKELGTFNLGGGANGSHKVIEDPFGTQASTPNFLRNIMSDAMQVHLDIVKTEYSRLSPTKGKIADTQLESSIKRHTAHPLDSETVFKFYMRGSFYTIMHALTVVLCTMYVVLFVAFFTCFLYIKK